MTNLSINTIQLGNANSSTNIVDANKLSNDLKNYLSSNYEQKNGYKVTLIDIELMKAINLSDRAFPGAVFINGLFFGCLSIEMTDTGLMTNYVQQNYDKKVIYPIGYDNLSCFSKSNEQFTFNNQTHLFISGYAFANLTDDIDFYLRGGKISDFMFYNLDHDVSVKLCIPY